MAAVLRAMGVESDQEILALVGSEPGLAVLLAPTLQEAKSMGLFIRQQALEYLGASQHFAIVSPLYVSQCCSTQGEVETESGVMARSQYPPMRLAV